MIKKLKPEGTVLVTGAAKRIGKAICLSLSSLGYKIALHYNTSSNEAKKLAKDIQANGGQCQPFCCDLSDKKQTDRLISSIQKEFPDLNVLINNASIFRSSTIKNATMELLHKDFAVNFDAPFILTAQFAKECKKGHIINILDTHITHSSTQHSTYLLSKKALWNLTQMDSLNRDLQIL